VSGRPTAKVCVIKGAAAAIENAPTAAQLFTERVAERRSVPRTFGILESGGTGRWCRVRRSKACGPGRQSADADSGMQRLYLAPPSGSAGSTPPTFYTTRGDLARGRRTRLLETDLDAIGERRAGREHARAIFPAAYEHPVSDRGGGEGEMGRPIPPDQRCSCSASSAQANLEISDTA